MLKVSVMVLTKNRAPLLREALESIRAQDFLDLEIIVVNDGSTDNTPAVIAEFSDSGRLPVIVINHTSSQGITASRAEAMAASQGQYIAILDDDDVWIDLRKLSGQVSYLDQNPECILVGGGMESVDGQGHGRQLYNFVSDWNIRAAMLLRNNFFTSTVMFRKSAAEKVGGFRGNDVAEDYDLWLRLGQQGKMHNQHKLLVRYRKPNYDKQTLDKFFAKQLDLVAHYKSHYPGGSLALPLLKLRRWLHRP